MLEIETQGVVERFARAGRSSLESRAPALLTLQLGVLGDAGTCRISR
jgi:hypothetical protein